MSKGKQDEVRIVMEDGIGFIDAMEIIKQAMKEIAPVNADGDGYLGWDMSKNVPGWKVEYRDYGVGKPGMYIVGKANVSGKRKESDEK